MAQSIEQRLLQAIKNDDARAYDALAETARIGEYRLGRFPVLSLLYLYKSRKIIAAHESKLLEISTYVNRSEPAEISRRFSVAAGKCLRLYYNEVASPLEMLLMLDRTKHLKRVFPYVETTEKIRARLQSIYSIKYALGVRFEGENIIIDKRPLNYREKKKIITASLCAALGVAVAVCVPTVTLSLLPKTIEGEVYALSDIDFSSRSEYVLKSDIALDRPVDVVNCSINGNGHKLTFSSGAAFGTFNGALTDVTVESSGGAIIYTVSSKARISDVTVNVAADISSDENTAFFALNNYGTIDGVSVNVQGVAEAAEPNSENDGGLTFGGIVMNNGYMFDYQTQEEQVGIIKNCAVRYLQFWLIGDRGADAAFGGIAGFNDGYLQDCTVTGEIFADTFDVAGVCVSNNGELNSCANKADITQSSAEEGWDPTVCGVVMNNTYIVRGCENTGKLSANSTCATAASAEAQTAVAAGIAYYNNYCYRNTPYIISCANSGEVKSAAACGNAYAAGVCYGTTGGVELCKNSGSVTAEAGGGYNAYVGGVADIAYGYIYKSESSGDITATGGGEAYAGGISAIARERFMYCMSSGDITVDANVVYAGGIFGASEVYINGSTYFAGFADHCISENRLDVTAIDGGNGFVGGIAGYIAEQRGGGSYVGGGVTYSCFIGDCVSSGNCFGNIVGICGENIYTNNSYYAGETVSRNFDGNYYAVGSNTAFGATLLENSSGVSSDKVADKGATAASVSEIKNTQTYRTILNELKSI